MPEDIRSVTNWGLYPRTDSHWLEGRETAEISAVLSGVTSVIPRGNGRCYGDSANNETATLSSARLNRLLSFDPETGELECESGVLFSDILEVFVPRGWFLPVTPGTKFISLGGAIAADVHGKNHHSEGNFSNHLLSIRLLLPGGELVECSPSANPDLFWATCGGMGLTGMILSARFRMKRVESAWIDQFAIKARNLEHIFRLFEQQQHWTYSVAWIDCLSKGSKMGRSVLMVGEHARADQLKGRAAREVFKVHPQPKLNMPFYLPSFALNTLSIKAFNFLYYNKQLQRESRGIVHYEPFYYPLDAIYNWNRMYGKGGFTQYQFAIPFEQGYEGMKEILETIASSGEGSFLAVLKQFGPARKEHLMSFPMAGYTLALDFKVSEKVFKLLDRLDELVLKYRGRLYLAKDVRMRAEMLDAGYPEAGRFREIIAANKGALNYRSLQSDRVGLSTL